MARTLKKIYRYADKFGSGLAERRLTTYAAACAYYIFMSLVPLIMLVISLLQFTPLSEELVLDAISEYVPDALYQLVESIVQGIYSGGEVALTVSILLTVWSASASMKALMRGMDSVYDAKRREDYFVFSFRACVYMVIFVLMLLLSLVVLVYGEQVQDLIVSYMPSNRFFQVVFRVINLRFIVILSVLTVVFSVLYKWMPAKKVRYTEQLPGSLFSAVAWMAFSYIFSFYVSLSDRFGAYGFIGTIMVAMMWLFYCFYFLLIGGYINRLLEQRRARVERQAAYEAVHAKKEEKHRKQG